MNETININKIFIEYLFSNPLIFFIYISLLCIYPLYKVVIPKYYGNSISILKNGPNMEFVKSLIKLLGLFSLYQLLASFHSKIQGIIIPKITEHATSKIFNNIVHNQDIDYDNIEVGEVLAKLMKVPNIIYKYLDLLRTLVFSQIAVFFVCLFHYYTVSFNTMICFFCLTLGIIFLQFITYKLTMNIEIQREQKKDNIYQHIQDVLNNLIGVVVCKNEKNEDKLLKDKFKPFIDIFNKSLNLTFIMRLIFGLFNIFSFVLLNYFIYIEYTNKNINKTQFISTFIVTYSILALFNESNYSIRAVVDMFSQVKEMELYFNNQFKNKNFSNNSQNNNKFKMGTIVFDNVSYKYTDNNDMNNDFSYALKNINIKINQNDNVAIIGQIGSGKSTLVKLLLKLIKPTEGKITINNIDLNTIPRDELYNHIFYIPQKPKLLNRTLYENIIYGIEHKIKDKNNTILKINQILKYMKIEDNIIKLFNQKMNKKLGNEGNKLSGGQRQIVWIIRAMLRDTNIIIFDEPTASLDKDNKNKIVNTIKNIGKDKTIFIISHDNINQDFKKISLKNGKIISSTNNFMFNSFF